MFLYITLTAGEVFLETLQSTYAQYYLHVERQKQFRFLVIIKTDVDTNNIYAISGRWKFHWF